MNKLNGIVILIMFLLGSCIVSNPKYFANIQTSTDKTYGYTPENPVLIKNADLQHSINSSYYYISRLRTVNGNKLKLIQRSSILNPKYKKPAIPLYNRYTGEPINGGGMILDQYDLKPENEPDTVIKIYINPYEKGIVLTAVGLKFENIP